MGAVDPGVRELAHEANFAVLSVLLGSGAAMSHVMWVDADDDHVLINTEVHRAKFKAIERDSRVTVTIWKRGDPYSYAEFGEMLAFYWSSGIEPVIADVLPLESVREAHRRMEASEIAGKIVLCP